MSPPVNGKWMRPVVAGSRPRRVAPGEREMEYTDLLFSICAEHGIRYYSATKTERCFVEELARRAWEEREDERVEL